MTTRIALAGALLAMGIALAGCSGGASNSASVASAAVGVAEADSGGAEAAQPAAAPSAAAGAAAGAASDDEAGSDALPVAATTDSRKIIRTASVTLQVAAHPESGSDTAPTAADLAAAAERTAHEVRALATQPGAYVSASDGHGATISVTLRIPAGSYGSVMGALAKLGTITSQSESTSDVTGEMIDVASRVASAKASVDRLRTLMTEATTVKDVIAIESELSTREADLESLQRRSAELADQVALSTITVTVEAVTPAALAKTVAANARPAFVAGLVAGWHGLAAFARVVATGLGALLPFLIPAAVLALVALMVRRRIRARRAPGTPTSEGPEAGAA